MRGLERQYACRSLEARSSDRHVSIFHLLRINFRVLRIRVVLKAVVRHLTRWEKVRLRLLGEAPRGGSRTVEGRGRRRGGREKKKRGDEGFIERRGVIAPSSHSLLARRAFGSLDQPTCRPLRLREQSRCVLLFPRPLRFAAAAWSSLGSCFGRFDRSLT